MIKKLSITEFLQASLTLPILDARAPAEYAKGHIPAAESFPLFSDDERAEIGTLYKQVSRDKAFLRGLDIAGGKMSWYLRRALTLAPERKAALHCWRGGMRSSSLATLLDFSGFEVMVLEGGYKAYRHYVLQQFAERTIPFLVLGGKTGSGKTEVLRHLVELGEQVIDLEGLAHHKGSAFGALGEAPQPSVEQFENDLFEQFDRLDPSRRVWVENESRNIGRDFIPQGFWDQMKSAPLFQLEVDFQERVKRLIQDYAAYSYEELENSLLKIERRMGGQEVKEALGALHRDELETATGIALKYYDKTYTHATSKGNFSKIVEIPFEKMDCRKAALQLIQLAKENGY